MKLSVHEQLKLKLKLEKTFKPDIRSIFNSMIQDFRITVARTGLSLDAQVYDPAWKAVLNKHYQRVQKAFSDVIGNKKSMKQEERTDEEKEELLLVALLTYRQGTVDEQSAIITNTNTKQMREAIRIARAEAFQNEDILTNAELALAASVILKRKFKPRINRIAMQETETTAEATKFISAEVESDLTPTIIGGAFAVTETEKKWHDFGDTHVRTGQFDHRSFTIPDVNLLQPFIVSGEKLMYPKDTSLGASSGNTQGCRCSSEYIF